MNAYRDFFHPGPDSNAPKPQMQPICICVQWLFGYPMQIQLMLDNQGAIQAGSRARQRQIKENKVMNRWVPRLSRWFGSAAIALCLSPSPVRSEDWASFRGRGDSIAHVQSLPIQWEMRGRVPGAWDVRLPGYGQSSPVVWKDRVFVTAVSGELKENLHVLAIDLASGSTLWQKDFEATQKVKDSDAVSRGAPTPAVDGQGLLVVFESGDVVALSHDGDVRWKRSFVADYGEIKGPHGYSSSPVLCNDRVILQVTHAGPSYVLALGRQDGKTLWKTDHPSQTGWSSPIVIAHEDSQLAIITSVGSVRAYDVRDGKEKWYVEGLVGNSTASPSRFEHSLLIGSGGDREGGGGPRRERSNSAESGSNAAPPESSNTSPSHKGSLRIALGGSGNVTNSHVTWSNAKATAGMLRHWFIRTLPISSIASESFSASILRQAKSFGRIVCLAKFGRALSVTKTR